jgi:transposase
MSKLREMLRLKFGLHMSHRQIAKSLSMSAGGVSELSRAAAAQGLTWPLPEALCDDELERRLYGAQASPVAHKVEPIYADMKAALARKGMTLQLLWEEYQQALSAERAYSRSQFCQRFRDWQNRQPLSMRQTHVPGEKMFVDYAGPTLPIVDPNTGEVRRAQIFVAVMGYSNYTYAEASWTQTLPDWLGAHRRALHFFGGVPQLIVPDNLKSGVRDACRFDPDLNPSYAHFAQHFAVAVMPARPYKPKDKAKAEVGVQIVERWVRRGLPKHRFGPPNAKAKDGFGRCRARSRRRSAKDGALASSDLFQFERGQRGDPALAGGIE